jgi:hypothetical protein
MTKQIDIYAEEWVTTKRVGPTGRIVPLATAEIVDHGGNLLGTATTRRGLRRAQNRWRIATEIRAGKPAGPAVEPSSVRVEYELCGIVEAEALASKRGYAVRA